MHHGQAIRRQAECRGEADATLAKLGTAVEIPLIGQIRVGSFVRSQEDTRVIAAFRAWSACMSGRGYKYERDAILEKIGDIIRTGGK